MVEFDFVWPLVCGEAPAAVRFARQRLIAPLLVCSERHLPGGYVRILGSGGDAA
jgi:hypothetical protein